MTKRKKSKPRAINLFSGCGGTGLALERAGYRSIGYDNWQLACDTHNANGMKAICCDLNVRLPKTKHKIDCVWASPPCQPFSNALEQEGEFDPRDGFPAYLKVLKKYRPRLTIFENVAGLTYKRHAAYLARIVYEIGALGYSVEWRLLNAADYGTPQSRVRIILIGRLDGKPRWPKKTHANKRVTVREALGTDGSDNPPGIDVRYLKTPSFQTGIKGSLLFNGRGRPLDLDAPSKTIYAAGGNHVHWFDVENQTVPYWEHLRAGGKVRTGKKVKGARRLTPAQSAILQGFPEDYVWCGLPSNIVKQIGNACPPQLAQAVIEANKA